MCTILQEDERSAGPFATKEAERCCGHQERRESSPLSMTRSRSEQSRLSLSGAAASWERSRGERPSGEGRWTKMSFEELRRHAGAGRHAEAPRASSWGRSETEVCTKLLSQNGRAHGPLCALPGATGARAAAGRICPSLPLPASSCPPSSSPQPKVRPFALWPSGSRPFSWHRRSHRFWSGLLPGADTWSDAAPATPP